jgi:hypothetical protein
MQNKKNQKGEYNKNKNQDYTNKTNPFNSSNPFNYINKHTNKTYYKISNTPKNTNFTKIKNSPISIFSKYNFLIILLISLFFILIITKIFKNSFINFLLRKKRKNFQLEKNLLNNENYIEDNKIDYYLNFQSIKHYLFFKENSHFKLKYGNNFDPKNYDMILIKKEFLDIIKNGKDKILKKLIEENLMIENFEKISYVINLILIFVSFFIFITFILLINFIYIELELGYCESEKFC